MMEWDENELEWYVNEMLLVLNGRIYESGGMMTLTTVRGDEIYPFFALLIYIYLFSFFLFNIDYRFWIHQPDCDSDFRFRLNSLCNFIADLKWKFIFFSYSIPFHRSFRFRSTVYSLWRKRENYLNWWIQLWLASNRRRRRRRKAFSHISSNL